MWRKRNKRPKHQLTLYTIPTTFLSKISVWCYQHLYINLHRWNLSKPLDCPLYGKRGNLQHVLSGCYISLTQGKYTWQHNQVHQEFGEMIEKNRETKQNTQETNI